jgi:hypothetical protein
MRPYPPSCRFNTARPRALLLEATKHNHGFQTIIRFTVYIRHTFSDVNMLFCTSYLGHVHRKPNGILQDIGSFEMGCPVGL